MSSFKNIPASERPRERLARCGGSSLSLIELLAILIGSGTKEKSVLDLSAYLLQRFGDLKSLAEASLSELLQVKGIGRAKAVQLKAAFAIGLRLQSFQEEERLLLDSPRKTVNLISQEMDQDQEILMVILRNAKRQLIHREIVSMGTVSEVILHPREIFHIAIRHLATSVIIAHNHPSGDPTPSKRDIEMTKLLEISSQIISIPLVDHLIVAKRGYVSLREMGFLEGKERY